MKMVIARFLIFTWLLHIKDFVTCTPDGLSHHDKKHIKYHPNWKYLDRENCGYSMDDRIIGGQDAKLGQYPWLAQIGYSPINKKHKIQFSCGGALINNCWVVTAAHCVTDLPSYIYVSGIRLGEYDTSRDIDCDDTECAPHTQDFGPARILMHKLYGIPKFQNDIALIKLNRPAEFTRWVSPVCLPYGQLLTKNNTGRKVEVAGWGIQEVLTSRVGPILQTVKLDIVSNERCRNSFKKKAIIDDHRQLCIGGVVGYDSCGGDSGGPMIMVDSITSPKYYIFGIVSFGSKYCGEKKAPGVYTNIQMYIKWILDNLTSCDYLA